jgi:hypothetical protein
MPAERTTTKHQAFAGPEPYVSPVTNIRKAQSASGRYRVAFFLDGHPDLDLLQQTSIAL